MSEQEEQDIIRFLQGKMNAEEALAFEARLEQEPTLKEEYEFYQDIASGIEQKKLIETVSLELEQEGFFDQDDSEHKSKTDKPPVPLRSRTIVMRYAAIFLLLGGLSIFLWANTAYSNQRLAAVNLEDIQNLQDLGSLKGENANLSALQLGIKAIQEEQYTDAVQSLESISSNSSDYLNSRLYLSLAQLKLKDFERALASTNEVISQTDNAQLKQKAQWMAIQIRLYAGDINPDFLEDLESIAKDAQHSFQEEATELQQKLNAPLRKLVL